MKKIYFGDEKKDQFRVFSLIHQTRHLLQGEIIKRMYPDEVLTKLNDDIELEETDTENFISYRLQDALLPWPLNMLHIIPDNHHPWCHWLVHLQVVFRPYGRLLYSYTRQ